MFGAFSVIPFISLSLVANVGVPETKLWQVFATAGVLTLFGAPIVGALADRFGKLRVFRIVASISAVLILVLTNLAVVPLAVAALLVGLLMVSNAGRMATGAVDDYGQRRKPIAWWAHECELSGSACVGRAGRVYRRMDSGPAARRTSASLCRGWARFAGCDAGLALDCGAGEAELGRMAQAKESEAGEVTAELLE